MLAGWIRTEYPHLVQGAIAGSAPIYGIPSFNEQVKLDSSSVTITRSLGRQGGLPTDNCATNLKGIWALMAYGFNTWGKQDAALVGEMGSALKLCKPYPQPGTGQKAKNS